MTSDTFLLSVHNLACARGERALFKGMNFAVGAGELLLVQGGNGQGKTSLLRLLTGLARPEEGEVRWRGHPIQKCREEFHAEMIYLGHANGVKDDLNPVENLRFAEGLQGRAFEEERAVAILRRLGLSRCLDCPAACCPSASAAAWRSPPCCWPMPDCGSWTSPSRDWTCTPWP
jgi:heme exporter protein A